MEKIGLKDFFNYKFLGNPTYSPKGKEMLFTLARIKKDGKNYERCIARLNEDKAQELTAWNVGSFVFLNEDEILFLSVRSDEEKEAQKNAAPLSTIYKLNLRGGEAQPLFTLNRSISALKVVDETHLALIENYDPHFKDYAKATEEEQKKMVEAKKEEADYHVFDEIPFWSNGAGVTNKQRSRLLLFNMETEEVKEITDTFTNVGSLDIHPKTKDILFIQEGYTDKAPLTNSIMLYSMEKGETEEITPLFGNSYAFAKFFGDDVITLYTDMLNHGVNENGSFLLFEPVHKRILKKEFYDLSCWSSVGSDVRLVGGKNAVADGKYFYFISTKEYNCQLFRLDKDLELKQVTTIEGSVDSIDVKDGKIISVALTEQKLQELYEIKDGNLHQISQINDGLKEKYVAKPQEITWEKDGYTYHGWVLLPEDFTSREKVPAILDIHGGPKTVYSTVFYHEMQYWAGLGYAVFFTNPRGSDGWGNDFMDIRGKYGAIDYEDLMEFTDKVLDKYPTIDTERLFVTGGSYGGFMTNWIVGHTKRFRAAASQRSISNWISMWGTTDIGYYFADDQTDSDIWESHDKMWAQSPLKYANQCTTPTLFIHSDEDFRCYMAEGIQMFTALKYHGCESRLVLFKGENHELSRSGKPHHRVRRLDEITQWFEKHK
ncbi:MAG: S9 family peptidase [Tissierellia bacterium]|nr:S9 family peptidase [Tissierellia bacterium]